MNRVNKLIKLKFKVIMFICLHFYNISICMQVSKRLKNLKCSYTAQKKRNIVKQISLLLTLKLNII